MASVSTDWSITALRIAQCTLVVAGLLSLKQKVNYHRPFSLYSLIIQDQFQKCGCLSTALYSTVLSKGLNTSFSVSSLPLEAESLSLAFSSLRFNVPLIQNLSPDSNATA